MKYTLIDTIAYRGDTRHPREIFSKGFWNKQNPEFLWQQIGVGQKAADDYGFELDVQGGTFDPSTLEVYGERMYDMLAITPLQKDSTKYRLYLKSDPSKYLNVELNKRGGKVFKKLYTHYASNEPQYRNGKYWKTKEPGEYGALSGKTLMAKLREDKRNLEDINPESAVCLTLRLDCAPYFPVEGTEVHGRWVWIYAVYVSSAIKTYSIQRLRGANVSFAMEIAVEHVPASNVLCAVKCKRKGKYPSMQFNFVPRIIWNPNVHRDIRARWSRNVEQQLSLYQGYLSICPTATTDTIRVKRQLIFDS